jgi:hypothetical protein
VEDMAIIIKIDHRALLEPFCMFVDHDEEMHLEVWSDGCIIQEFNVFGKNLRLDSMWRFKT